MSRQHLAVLRAAFAFALIWIGAVHVPTVLGQADNSATPHGTDMLGIVLETQAYTEPMPLKQFLQLIYEQCAAKGADVRILVDISSFKAEEGSEPNGPVDDEITLSAVPKTVTIGQALQIALRQVKSNNATFIVRNGGILVLTRKAAGLAARLREPVAVRFDKTPLSDVMDRLSDMAGATIVLDPRLHEKAQTPVTANFRGDVPLESALRAVADMAELRIVPLIDGGIYVTTPANAEALEKQIRDRQKELDKEKAKQKTKDAPA